MDPFLASSQENGLSRADRCIPKARSSARFLGSNSCSAALDNYLSKQRVSHLNALIFYQDGDGIFTDHLYRSSVEGNILGPCDNDTCLLVRNLHTPLGLIREAKLRVMDVMAIEFPAAYSVPEDIQDLFSKR